MRDAERIEAQQSETSQGNKSLKTGRGKHPNSLANLALAAPFQPGVSGNPGGRPKRDVAADIARKVFELNEALVYKSYVKALAKGSGFTFQVLSDRAYGKLTERVQMEMNVSVGERLERAKARRKGQK